MSSSSWPILLGMIALVAGAVWFDAQNGATASQGVSNTAAQLQTAAK